jgi:hypothetical protein
MMTVEGDCGWQEARNRLKNASQKMRCIKEIVIDL